MVYAKRSLYLGVFMAVCSYAECVKSYGGVSCGAGQIDSVNDVGNVVLSGTEVKNGTTVNGQLTASQSTFNTLTVNGKALLSNSDVKGKSNIRGYLEAIKTQFHAVVAIHANEAAFSDSTLQSITVTPNESDLGKIHLKGHTVVQGDVTFVPAGGEILLDRQSTIAGKVIGATITKTGE